jgi:hypothetical protein
MPERTREHELETYEIGTTFPHAVSGFWLAIDGFWWTL